MTHYALAGEHPTRFGEIYTACRVYTRLQDIRASPEDITCETCKTACIDETTSLTEFLNSEAEDDDRD